MNIKFLSFLFSVTCLAFSCNSQNRGQVLNPVAFNQKISDVPDAIILDVRTPEEYNGGFISGATNINYNSDNFKNDIEKLDKNKTYLVYCLSGKRSASAASYMRDNGFKDVYNLQGGILAWQNSNLPLVTKNSMPVSDKISQEEYAKMISSDSVILVDYFASWCAPCVKMKPMLDEVSKEYAGKVKFVRIDISENKELAKKINVIEIPVLKKFVNGKETWSHQGYIDKEELIKQL